MDFQILRSLISGSSVFESLKLSQEWKTFENDKIFPPLDDVLIDAISQSLSDHLSYKVSTEAHQRYLVRINIIEILRSWLTLEGELQEIPAFEESEKASIFFLNFLQKSVRRESLNNFKDVKDLLHIAKLLRTLMKQKKCLKKIFENVIERMIDLPQTDSSIHFLENILQNSEDLALTCDVIESIYNKLNLQLVQTPIEEAFTLYVSNPNDENMVGQMETLCFQVVDKPSLFQLISRKLKDLFVMTKNDQTALNFIQKILEKIQLNCSKFNKDVLDLYPINLQFCVVLLRIKPSIHTKDTKNYTLDSLSTIYLNDHNNAMILLSHYPEWTTDFYNYCRCTEYYSSESEVTISSSDNQ